jgi:predicted phosphodiesterase
MKIQVMSDLHLEFERYLFTNHGQNDVLILAGDICEIRNYQRLFVPFMRQALFMYDKIFYVMGNHECYGSGLYSTIAKIKEFEKEHEKFVFLNNSKYVHEGVLFTGGVLWTDLRKGDPIAMRVAEDCMNDYNYIQDFKPESSIAEHNITRVYLAGVLLYNALYEKKVVITHHSPSFANENPKYKNSGPEGLNYSFHSTDMDHLLLNYEVDWIHGHSHMTSATPIGQSTIHCNSKGYGNENPDFNPNYVIEI